jgi:hypothetical protein
VSLAVQHLELKATVRTENLRAYGNDAENIKTRPPSPVAGTLSSASFGFLSTRPASAQVEELGAAFSAAQAIGSFIHRPDGLGAVMRGMNQKLDLIVAEIARIELALADIQLAIAKLRDAIPEMVSNSLTELVVDELRSSGNRWFDQKIKSSDDVERLNETRKNLVLHIISRLEDKVYDLATNDRGSIPHAALVAPWALAVHLNILSLFQPEAIPVALRRHLAWYDNILNPEKPGSVAYLRGKRIDDRNTLLGNISKTMLAKGSDFDREKLTSTNIGLAFVCVKESRLGRLDIEKIGVTVVAVWKIVRLFSSDFPQIALRSNVGLQVPQWVQPDIKVPLMPRCSYEVPWSAPGGRPATAGELQNYGETLGVIGNFKAETKQFLEKDAKGSSGLLVQFNDLSRRIDFLEKVISLIEDTRAEARALQIEVGQ